MTNSDANVKQQSGISVVLSLNEHQAAELLAIGKTDEQVAQLVGVETRIIEQWQQKPEFVAGLNMLRVASLDSSRTTEGTERSEPITTLVDVSRFL